MLESQGTKATPMNKTSMELKEDRELVISRTFNGPPRIVFDAYTRAELVKRWWAPKSHGEIVDCTAEVRVGGKYRYAMRTPDGTDVAFSGRYLEITPPSRLVYTQVFEQMADAGEMTITVTFEELGGKTLLVSREVYPSKEARDSALESGMEHGMKEAMDQLDVLVASLC